MKDSLLHENWESGKEETDPVLRVFQNCLFPFPAGRPPSLTGFLWWYITQYNYLSSDYVSILKDRRQGRSLVVTFMILLQSTDITNWATKQSNVRFSIKILTIYCLHPFITSLGPAPTSLQLDTPPSQQSACHWSEWWTLSADSISHVNNHKAEISSLQSQPDGR